MVVRVLDKYEPIRKLASGGMGDIYLARQVGAGGFSRPVVLKSLKQEVVENEDVFAQFLGEARLVARMSHPNVVVVYEVGQFRGIYFIAMEHIQGVDMVDVLRAVIKKGQRIPFRVAASLILDSALALDYAHRGLDDRGQPFNLVHRDVSPHNIMVRYDGRAKVIDFGIATVADAIDPSSKFAGKFRYMAPEQARGAVMDGRADEFALGIVLWELCTLKRLFPETAPIKVFERLFRGDIPPPSRVVPDIPPALEAIVVRMLHPDPNRRFPTLEAAGIALRTYLETGPGKSPDQLAARFIEAVMGPPPPVDLSGPTLDLEGLLGVAAEPCPSCGRHVSARQRFCGVCGVSLRSRETTSGNAPQSVLRRERSTGRPTLLTPKRALSRSTSRSQSSTDARTPVPTPIPDRSSSEESHVTSPGGADPLGPLGEVRRVTVVGVSWAANFETEAVASSIEAAAQTFEADVVQVGPSWAEISFGLGSFEHRLDHRAARFALSWLERVASFRGLRGVSVAIASSNLSVEPGQDARHALTPTLEYVRELARRARIVGRPTIALQHEVARSLGNSARIAVLETPEGRLLELQSLAESDRGTPFVGRREDLVESRLRLLEAVAGRASVTRIEGDRGLGKTRFLREIQSMAEKKGLATVFLNGSDRAEGEAALMQFVQLLSRAVHPEAQEHSIDELMSFVPQELRHPLKTRALSSLSSGLVDSGDRIGDESALSEILRRVSLARPFALLIDDAHRITTSVLRVASAIATPGAKVAVFAARLAASQNVRELSGRTMSKTGELERPLLDVGDNANAFRINLGRLTDDRILQIAQSILGGRILPPLAAEVILEKSRGSPAVAVAVVRTMLDSGVLSESEGRFIMSSGVDVDLPSELEGLLDSRLSSASEPARRFLVAAAVAGAVFDPLIVGRAVGLDPNAVSVELQRLGFLRGSAEAGRFAFESNAIRDRISLRTLPADRAKISRRLAESWIAAGPKSALDEARIAWLLLDSDAGRRSLEWAVRAAESLGGSDGSHSLYRQALHVIEDGFKKGWLSENDAELIHRTVAAATVSLMTADLDEACQVLGRVEGFVRAEVDPPGRSLALLERASARIEKKEAKAALQDLDCAQTLGIRPETKSRHLLTRARAHEALGELSLATKAVTEALVLEKAKSEADQTLGFELANTLGRLYFRMGDLDRAERLFTEALSRAAEAKSPPGQAKALSNLASVEATLGRAQDALATLDDAESIAAATFDRIGLARIAFNRGQVYVSSGKPLDAEDSFTDARDHARAVGWTEGLASATQALSSLKLVSRQR